jgi:hypothetical protein
MPLSHQTNRKEIVVPNQPYSNQRGFMFVVSLLILAAFILFISLAIALDWKDREAHAAKAATPPEQSRYQKVSESRVVLDHDNDRITILVVKDTQTGKCQSLSLRYEGPAVPINSETPCGEK